VAFSYAPLREESLLVQGQVSDDNGNDFIVV
jgi:hypothetical protein